MNQLPSERVAVVGEINPDAYGAGSYATEWVPVKNFRRFMAVVQAGDLGASATLDARLRGATDVAGTGATNLANTAITQLTQAGSDSNKDVVINFNTAALAGPLLSSSLPITHIQLQITVAVATSDAGGILLGFDPFNGPASDYDSSAVDEIVTAPE